MNDRKEERTREEGEGAGESRAAPLREGRSALVTVRESIGGKEQ